MKKSIILIFNNRFPDGGAGANRQLTIAKGLLELGNDVRIHLIRPTEDKYNKNANPISGSYEGVSYRFMSGTNIWKQRNKISKQFLIWYGVFNSIKQIISLKRKNNIDIIISSFSSFNLNIIYALFCKLLRIKFIHHIDEYPWMVIFPEKYNKLYSVLYVRYFYKLFDGIVVISNSLRKYYTRYARKGVKIFLLPMTVDAARFSDIKTKEKPGGFDLMYVGNMSPFKDGVDILIKAFSDFYNKIGPGARARLLLVGSNKDEKIMNLLNTIIRENQLEEVVLFLGEKQREEIPELISNSSALALARPESKQAEGGFPTKLGEYLMTKRPVIVTNVGEIPDYLVDNVSAYIASPDETSFSQKIMEVYKDYHNAEKVGLEGYNVALANFEYKKQIIGLNDFLDNLIEKNKL